MHPDSDTPSLLLGLIGEGIGESLSPTLYEDEAARHGILCIYQRIDLDVLGLTSAHLDELLTAAERFGFAGLNITHPCKQAVIPHLHELSDEARAIGAVNTVVLRDGRRIGHNTDHYGFSQNIREHLGAREVGRVVQVGAGGAGSAVADAILGLGAQGLTVFDPAAGRAEALAQALQARFPNATVRAGGDLAAAMREADGLVNATPVGMRKHPGTPLPAELLESRHWLSELIYFPLETELLRVARAKGCHTIDGLGMVVHQAARAFELYTNGIPADAPRMAAHVAEVLAKRAAALDKLRT
ncbi:shikimate dehydrogenase [Castellaniella sp. S9]|uniref:shikimate dehydrogenase n=1 Tax=Castellaniella sp. S9 TaxID=2993652 RepID=UPI0022B3613E|nr:shikimate dehydrogenase [Castellaniella sp. S9]